MISNPILMGKQAKCSKPPTSIISVREIGHEKNHFVLCHFPSPRWIQNHPVAKTWENCAASLDHVQMVDSQRSCAHQEKWRCDLLEVLLASARVEGPNPMVWLHSSLAFSSPCVHFLPIGEQDCQKTMGP